MFWTIVSTATAGEEDEADEDKTGREKLEGSWGCDILEADEYGKDDTGTVRLEDGWGCEDEDEGEVDEIGGDESESDSVDLLEGEDDRSSFLMVEVRDLFFFCFFFAFTSFLFLPVSLFPFVSFFVSGDASLDLVEEDERVVDEDEEAEDEEGKVWSFVRVA